MKNIPTLRRYCLLAFAVFVLVVSHLHVYQCSSGYSFGMACSMPGTYFQNVLVTAVATIMVFLLLVFVTLLITMMFALVMLPLFHSVFEADQP